MVKLAEMPYLDMCVCEALRMFPPVIRYAVFHLYSRHWIQTEMSKGRFLVRLLEEVKNIEQSKHEIFDGIINA